MNDNTKPAVQCVSMWGSLVSTLAVSLPLVSVDIAQFAPSRYVRLTAFLIGIVGTILSTYGRVVDTKKISGIFRK